MASFTEHIRQATSNLLFLTETNSKNQQFWDWQVTTGYYVAVHIINAHLDKVANLHYRTHEDVKNAINPFNSTSLCKIPQDVYLNFQKLEGLSRRARYLCHDDPNNHAKTGHLTHDRHFAKAIKNLDNLLNYFTSLYALTYPKPEVACIDLSQSDSFKIFGLKKTDVNQPTKS